MTFTEIADRVWVGRHEWFDINVTAIGGERGLVVVDTLGSGADGVRLRAELAPLGEVHAVVNTHWHFDHTFGNSAFDGVPIHAHETAAIELNDGFESIVQRYRDDADDPHRDDVIATELVAPTETFSSVRLIGLGDRVVELLHPGRAHTAGDLIVHIADAGVILAGDLVEESAPPSYGDDSWPLEWPLALDMVLGLSNRETTIVPGHGAVVDRDFVEEQRAQIGIVAETIRDLAGRGVPEGLALASADWPFPAESLGSAVRRAYAHLPRAQKRLPLI
ncbi:MAG: MBL fold metallo-hydrolase [Myxococcales bacterium]|nr:MAG: MBL fold metallo-hydrolase [Myxococcales bacterium]